MMFPATLSSSFIIAFSLWHCVGPATALPTFKSPSLLDISITELGALLEAGDFNSHDLVELYIQRVREVNDDLRAVIELNPDALSIAKQLDKERADGTIRGPLHGIPILVKDNYATVDAMMTGAGSVCLARTRPSEEATAIAKLRKAGAVVLGKANLSEFAGIRGDGAKVGWSPRGGQTYGAYVKHQTACGSSSGSGVAASVGLAAGTLGTETAGSITCPAMVGNVVGIKPTVGLTSRYGIVPITARQDTAGPLAQSVEDAAIIMDAIAGKDLNDNYTSAQPWDVPPSFAAALDTSALRGARIGVIWTDENFLNAGNFANLNYTKPVFKRALADLKAAGAEIIDVDLSNNGHTIGEFSMWVYGNISTYMSPDVVDSMARYLKSAVPNPDAMHNVSDIFQCLKTEPKELASKYGIDDWEHIAQINTTADSLEAWEAYVTASTMARDLLLNPIKDHKLDALVMQPELALVVAASPGLPIVTVPMGVLGQDASTIWDHDEEILFSAPGVPLGISFTAGMWSDQKLIRYAYAYEQISRNRRKLVPAIKPKSDLDVIMGRQSFSNEL
ncbi:amidase signature enzyme [Xylariaceae sp. FL1651]|nr:amidase signature enzyme [Xylariaceae sp. FL1651]